MGSPKVVYARSAQGVSGAEGAGGREPPCGCGYPIRCRPRGSGGPKVPRVPEGLFLAEGDAAAVAATREATAATAASMVATLTTPLTPELAAGLDGGGGVAGGGGAGAG